MANSSWWLIPLNPRDQSWIDWCSAWNFYVAVLAGANASDSSFLSRLLKHAETVIDLARANKDWRYYDSEFRRLVSLGLASCGQIHTEVLNEARG